MCWTARGWGLRYWWGLEAVPMHSSNVHYGRLVSLFSGPISSCWWVTQQLTTLNPSNRPKLSPIVPLLSLLHRLTCGTHSDHKTHHHTAPCTHTHIHTHYALARTIHHPPTHPPQYSWTSDNPWTLSMPYNCPYVSSHWFFSPILLFFPKRHFCQVRFGHSDWSLATDWKIEEFYAFFVHKNYRDYSF